jgi:hypothetical protein
MEVAPTMPQDSIPHAEDDVVRLSGSRKVRTYNRRQLELQCKKEPPAGRYARPTTREECEHLVEKLGFCPYVGCRHHLYLDVCERTGSITFNFPDLGIDEIPACCALDIADEGRHSLEEIGDLRNMTRERIRQIEASGLRAMAGAVARGKLDA